MKKIEILDYKGHKFMFIDGYLWMWDIPRERNLQKDLANKAFGNVLIAGYGFGILTEYCLKNPKVKSVTTVEKYREVIDKMKEYGKIFGKIIINDFYELSENQKFDCVIGDIWPDIDAEFLTDYVNFKNKSEKLLNRDGLLLAWGKDYYEFLLMKNNSPSAEAVAIGWVNDFHLY